MAEIPSSHSPRIWSPMQLPSIDPPPVILEPMEGELRGFGLELEGAAEYAIQHRHYPHAQSLMRSVPSGASTPDGGWLEALGAASAGRFVEAAEVLRASQEPAVGDPRRADLVPPALLRSLERHLLLRPDDEDALLLDAELRAALGDFAVLELDLRTLRQLDPDEPRLGALERRALALVPR